MRSKIYWGSVYHWRGEPKEHKFTYPIFSFGIDVREHAKLSKHLGLITQSGLSVFKVRAEDYICSESGTLEEKVKNYWIKKGATLPENTVLYTMPRYFGYVFNPVSFYVSTNTDGTLHSLLIEVNNTFGETHLYPCIMAQEESSDLPKTFTFDKKFFVSPFFNVSGDYQIVLHQFENELDIEVILVHSNLPVFSARLSAKGEKLSLGRLWATLWRYPVTSLLTMPRIHMQALKLYRHAGVGAYEKPAPSDQNTIRSKQNWIHRLRLKLLKRLKQAE